MLGAVVHAPPLIVLQAKMLEAACPVAIAVPNAGVAIITKVWPAWLQQLQRLCAVVRSAERCQLCCFQADMIQQRQLSAARCLPAYAYSSCLAGMCLCGCD